MDQVTEEDKDRWMRQLERVSWNIARDLNEEAKRRSDGFLEREPGAGELWYYADLGHPVMEISGVEFEPTRMIKFPVESMTRQTIAEALFEHVFWVNLFAGKYRGF